MMRTFPRPTEPRLGERGFTLIEMLVVLTIVGLVAAVGAVTLQRHPGHLTRQRAAIQVKAAAEQARQQAMETGRASLLDLSKIPAAKGTLTLGAKQRDVKPLLAFYPDGSSTGGTVLLDESPLVRIDWLTGRIVDVRG